MFIQQLLLLALLVGDLAQLEIDLLQSLLRALIEVLHRDQILRRLISPHLKRIELPRDLPDELSDLRVHLVLVLHDQLRVMLDPVVAHAQLTLQPQQVFHQITRPILVPLASVH